MCVYITGHLDQVFPKEHRKEILRYIYYHQNEDGGWGLHIEGHSTMFCTTLSYICMRILGEGPDGGLNNACARGRKWILDHGSVTYIPSWGKTWLSVRNSFSFLSFLPPLFFLINLPNAALLRIKNKNRYLVYMIGPEATQCRQSFGYSLRFCQCTQV